MSEPMSRQAVMARIAAGEDVPAETVIQALAIGPLVERRIANIEMANAYLKAGKIKDAILCIERSWFLGHRASDAVTFLIDGLVSLGRQRDALDRAREAGILAVRTRDPRLACDMVGKYNGIAASLGLPIHDALLSAEVIALLRQEPPPLRRRGGPLRIGYLFWGEEQENNVLPPLLIETARYQDRSRFEPVFFSIHPESGLMAHNKSFSGWLAEIKAMGASFVGNDPAGTVYEMALNLANKIRQQEIDVLVPIGQLTLNFLVAAMRPAPLIVGFDVGNPHVYGSPALDHIVTAQRRFTMEEQCDASNAVIAYTAYQESAPPALDRISLAAGEDDVIVMTSGSAAKFRSPAFLKMLAEVVVESPKVRLYLVGPKWESDVGTFMRSVVPAGDLARVSLLGYRTDFSSVIRAADIYVETHPVSGGWATYEALVAGVPTVSFDPVLWGLFNKHEHYTWAAQVLAGSGITVPGDDVGHIKRRILELAAQPELRRAIGARGPELMRPLLDKAAWTRTVEGVISSLLP